MEETRSQLIACQDRLPLTPAQAGMYFQYLADPDSRTYTQQMVLHLHGPADLDALARAWDLVARRHQALRAVFAGTPDGAIQIIRERPPHVFTLADLSDLPETLREQERTALIRSERECRLDIEHGPTLRGCLIRLAAEAHILSLTFHHILMDGWCTAILLNEMLSAHEALRRGREPDLAPPPSLAPALDWLAARDTEADATYWRDYLEGFAEASPLAGRLAVANRPGAEYHLREQVLSLGPAVTRQLNALAAKTSVTPSALLQAAWAVLLARQTDCRDVVFGLVTSGREADVEGMERLVGVFIRTLPVRLRLDDPQETLAGLARRIQAEAVRRLPHEALPLPDIQAQTSLGTNLFDHLLLFENYPTDLAASGLQVAEVTGFEQLPYDFGLAVLPGEDLKFRFSFNAAVHSAAYVEAVGKRWLTLLRAAVETPDTPALNLNLLPDEERRHLARFAEITRRDWPDCRPVPSLFADKAAEAADRTAIIVPAPGGDRQVCYAELAGRVGQLAELLLRQGISRETPVAVCLERGGDLPAALLAVQTVGAPYVPLDPLYPPDRLAYILADCGAQLVLAQRSTAGVLGQSNGTGPHLVLLDEIPWTSGINPRPTPAADDLAYIIYTSGSTGKPKGVEVTHRGLTNFLLSMAEAPGLSAGDILLAVTTICFDIAGLELFLPLILGARLVLASREDAADAQRLMTLMEDHDVSVLQATPTTWNMLMAAGWSGRSSLKALVGGEALPPRLADAMLSRCGKVWNLYGPTETTIWSTLIRLQPVPGDLPRVTIGTPLANTTIYILANDLSLMPEGGAGELCIGGDGLARGYRNRPDLTAERFVTLPFAPYERVYRTGDLAVWTEQGDLAYLGRTDFQVKVRGFRIEPGEIETRLTAIPGISQAVVMAGDYRGTGTELAAWIVGGEEMPDNELRRQLLRDLPYYMAPALFFRMADLPQTPNGKIDRKALPLPQSFEADNGSVETCPSMAENEAQQALAAIWRNILRLDRIDPKDSFFDLGGHSLLAMRLTAAVEEATGLALPLRTIFEHPTLAAQAEILSRQASRRRAAIPPALKAEHYPLTPVQHRLWALQRMSPDVSAYAVPGLVVLEGETDANRLRRAVTEAANRHDSLRTCFVMDGSEPRQMVLDDPPDFFEPDIDLSDADDPRAAAIRLADEMADRPFDLDRPLLRARLLRLGAKRYALCLVLHHLVCDEWSLDILLRDIGARHQQLRNSAAALPPTGAIGYPDYAVWLNQRLAAGELAAARDWWAEQLAPPFPPLDLCPDLPRPPAKTFAGASRRFTLNRELHRDLKNLAVSGGTTEFTVLATLLLVLLFRESNQRDIRLGVPMAGRDRPELADLVGMFVNTLVLRRQLEPEASFTRTLSEVAETLRQAMDRAEYPFEALLDELRPAHDPSRTPLFDVMMVLKDSLLPSDLDELRLTSLPLARKNAKFDLSFLFEPAPDGGLAVEIEYAADLFTARRIDALGRQFATLARAAASRPETAVADLNRLSPDDDPATIEAAGQPNNAATPAWPQAEAVAGSDFGETEENLERLFGPGSKTDTVRLTPSQAGLLPGLGLARSSVATAILYAEPAGPAAVRALLGLNPQMAVFEEHELAAGGPRLTRRLSPDAATAERRIFDRPAGNAVHILDPRGCPCPLLSPGELCLNGVASNLESGVPGVARTGRRARLLDDGCIELLGTIRPPRPGLDPEAVALAIEASPQVARAVVIAPGNGHSTTGPVAFVLPAVSDPRRGELLRFLRQRLPTSLVPEHIRFLDSLPLTADGRLDRDALTEMALAIASAQPSQPAGEPPRSETETRLCTLFAQSLGIEQASPDSHFFAWGGDSLKALRLCAAVEAAFGQHCPAGELFRSPTPAELALRLEELQTLNNNDAEDTEQSDPGFDSSPLSEEERRILLELAGK